MEEAPTLEEFPTNVTCTEKDNGQEDSSTVLSGKYLKSLVTIPTGQSLQDRLTKLKERKPARACFESAIHHPLKIVEDRFKCLSIDGRPVVVKPYPQEADLKVFNYSLLAFDPSYDPDIRSKS